MPEVLTVEQRRFPAIEHVVAVLGGSATVTPIAVPIDCIDGFGEAYYAWPERFIDPAVRQAESARGFVDPATAQAGLARLAADLESGEWDRRFGAFRTPHSAFRTPPELIGCLRLITALPD